MAVPVVRFPIFLLVRVIGIAVAALVLIWNVHYRGGLALISDNKALIFNVHPVLMVIGLVLLNGEAMLAYKTVSGTKSFRKSVHLVLQFLAFFLSLIGLWAAWKFHNDKGIDNFYSLHSWLGLFCLFLFGVQFFNNFWTVGCWFCNFLVSRWFKEQQSDSYTMACLFWHLYICPCYCYLCYWLLRESYIPSSKPHNLTLLHRGIASELFGCLDCCFGWIGYSRCRLSNEWKK
ncbi:hypothetical protein AABB24_003057 [Solanum stoloniferum]|uniref:Cytochrome b561 domain-containing protein n=1 Tax=Solanum stoloniferum TaxID=62892 RepID=A0ABD2V9P2_9SOLN